MSNRATQPGSLNMHLTEDDLTACIIQGGSVPVVDAHLAVCAPCANRLQAALLAFDAPVNDFSRAALAWSDARPVLSLSHRAQGRAGRATPALLGWALAAASLLVVAVPAWQHTQHRSPADGQAAVPAARLSDSAAQIASDDRMLQQVDVALADESPSPFRDFGLTDEPEANPQVRTRTR